MSEKDRKQMEEEVDAEIKQAVAKAEALAKSDEYANPLIMFDHLFEAIPPCLQEQRDELARHLKKDKQKASSVNPQKDMASRI